MNSFHMVILPALSTSIPHLQALCRWLGERRARLLAAAEVTKTKRNPLKGFPLIPSSKTVLNSEKHLSHCYSRSSASLKLTDYRVLPWEPFSSHSSQEPSHSKWITSHHTFPIAVLLYPLYHWQGSRLRGDSRWDLEGGKCISQLYYLPHGFPFGDPNTARDGCCEKQLLPCALHRTRQGSCRGAACWDRQKERVFSLGVYSTQDILITSSTGSPFQLSL